VVGLEWFYKLSLEHCLRYCLSRLSFPKEVSTQSLSASVVESDCPASLSESAISCLIAAVSFSSPSNGSSGLRYPTTDNTIVLS
jgi:hypothetical protein